MNGLVADAVFEGGGVRGIGLAGAAAAMEDRGYRWANLAGTSAGAVVAALLAAGYSAAELAGIMERLDYRKFRDPGVIGRIPLAGPALDIIVHKGVCRGTALEEWLRGLLRAKGVRTFSDLIMDDFRDDPRYRYRLSVIAADITAGRLLVLPQDAAVFGVKPEDLDAALAVRMSMGIPFYYRPVVMADTGTGTPHHIVDGGILSNFPVWIFDTGEMPPWPTFGFRLIEPGEDAPRKIRGPVSMATALLDTMMNAHDDRFLAEADFVRTVSIPTLGVKTTDFDITPEKGRALFESGYRAAERFLEGWDFPEYVGEYRQRVKDIVIPGERNDR